MTLTGIEYRKLQETSKHNRAMEADADQDRWLKRALETEQLRIKDDQLRHDMRQAHLDRTSREKVASQQAQATQTAAALKAYGTITAGAASNESRERIADADRASKEGIEFAKISEQQKLRRENMEYNYNRLELDQQRALADLYLGVRNAQLREEEIKQRDTHKKLDILSDIFI